MRQSLSDITDTIVRDLGPTMYTTIVETTRAEFRSQIALTIMWTALLLAAALLLRRAAAAAQCACDASGDKDYLFLRNLVLVFSWAALVLATIVGVWLVIDPWTWVALEHPDLWLAHKVLSKIL